MKIRTVLTVLLLVCVPLTGHAAKKKKPLAVEVSASSAGLPLVTLTASDAPLGEVAERLAKKLGTTIDVSAAARNFRVTTELDQQPLDLTLRELAPQAYVDGILTGGTGKTVGSVHSPAFGRRGGAPAGGAHEELLRGRDVLWKYRGSEHRSARGQARRHLAE